MGDFSRMKHYVMKLENTNIVIIDIDVENLHQATKNLVGFLDFFLVFSQPLCLAARLDLIYVDILIYLMF